MFDVNSGLQRAGFNRTGFVLCAYLIQVCGLTVDEALASFAAARPPGVKHEKFVAEVRALLGHSAWVPRMGITGHSCLFASFAEARARAGAKSLLAVLSGTFMRE